MDIPIYLTLIRLVAPFLILRFPFFGILLCTLIDMYDWKFVSINSEADFFVYQNWDKFMDLYYLTFAFSVVFKFKDKLAKSIALYLFGYRLLGLSIYFVTSIKSMLFFFPNVFENFFIFYISYVHFSKREKLLTSKNLTILILSSLIIPKLIHEYFMHYLNKQPWEIYDIGSWLGANGVLKEYANYLIWGSLFYLVPFLIFVYLLKKRV